MKKRYIFTIVVVVIFVSGYFLFHSYSKDLSNPSLQSYMSELARVSGDFERSNHTYKNFCTSSEALGVPEQVFARGPLPNISMFVQGNLTSYRCNDSSEHWAVTIPLTKGKYICIDDSLGNKSESKIINNEWEPNITLGFLVSSPLLTEMSCSQLPLVQVIKSK